jgi:predicted metal-dependent hydrolase
MPILDTLKLADNASKRAVSKENGFRTKLLEALDLQIAAVKAELNGQPFKRTVQRWMSNEATHSREHADVEVRFRPWWWKDTNGIVLLEIRYANKPVEIKPGKTAITIGTMDKLVPTLEQIKSAVSAGELDKPILAIVATRKKAPKQDTSQKPVKSAG